MNTGKINLKQAFDLLEYCDAIILNDDVLIYPATDTITGEPENEFLYLSYTQNDLIYSLYFIEENNQEIEFSGSTMYLEDNEGDSVRITLLSELDIQDEL